MRARVLGLAVVGALLSACSSTEEPPMPFTAENGSPALGFVDTQQVIIPKAGDTLRIVAFGSSDLSGDYRVDDEGRIHLGSYGVIPVSGLSLPEVENRIAAHLARQGKTDVRISVLLLN